MEVKIYEEWNNDVISLAKQINEKLKIIDKEMGDIRFFVNELYNLKSERSKIDQYRNKEMGF
jgi:hypothetical protein